MLSAAAALPSASCRAQPHAVLSVTARRLAATLGGSRRALSGGIVNLQREGPPTHRGKEVTVYIKGFLSLGEQPENYTIW